MKFILLSSAILAATTLASAWQCTPGTKYCGSRYIGVGDSDYWWYWGAMEQSAHEAGIPKAHGRYTLFECTEETFVKVEEDCGVGSCISPGGKNNDYCV
ncbi:hypothetical protein DFH06DRAFT_1317367 [Mycena polygramma]|nr:hypothetical protein DFH06DRAFT_1317367 [Mycena polygramma]